MATNRPPRWAAGLFAVIGFGLLASGLWLGQRQVNILKNWPRVEAEVTRSELVQYRDSEGDTLYKAAFTFRYTVGGREYETSTDTGYGTSSHSHMQGRVDRFAPGSHHDILYNPGDPGDIRFDPGFNLQFFLLPGILTGMGLVFGGAGVALLRAKPAAAPEAAPGAAATGSRCPGCGGPVEPGARFCPRCGAVTSESQ